MFVTNERKPKITSNWFSSLRRQPKNKKPDYNYLQKSCLDLTTTSSAITTSPTSSPLPTLVNKKLNIYHNVGNNISTSSLSSTASAFSIPISVASTTSSNSSTADIDQNLCPKCFTKLKSQHELKRIDEKFRYQQQQQQQQQQQKQKLEQQKQKLQQQQQKELQQQQQQLQQKQQTELNELSKIDDVITNSNQTIYYFNKKEEFSTVTKKTTTTTTITRTTILNKDNEQNRLVFGENGDLLTDIYNKKKFLLNHQMSINNNCNNKIINNNNNNNSSSNNNNLYQYNNNNKYLNKKKFHNIKNRDGLVFNDNGEIIKSNPNLLLLNVEHGSTNTVSSLARTPTTTEDDFEYIDDTTFNEIYDNEFKLKICPNCKCNNVRSQSEWNLSTRKQIKDELCEVVSEMEALDSPEDCKHSNKDKQMSIGRKKFNMDPKKGIEYLVENHLLQMDAQGVAHFLYKGEGLNKTAIGDYLGEKNDFNEQVLKAFVELHDFTNLILVQALRQFLWSFRLPGEAQKIDRMMECFAQRYCQLNPDIFTNTDTCYVLSFAIIMLNTSLHNPSVKDKPSVEQFISMNRGINNGGDLPRELLESLYDSIRTEPFKIPQDDGNDLMHTFFNPDKEGWLWKQGGRYKSWKRRWFILNDNCLYYFEYTTDKEPRGIIPLENISVREITDRNKPHCFELYACGDIIKACKTDSEGKVVEGKHTVYRMSAATEEDKLDWIKCLTQSISYNPFYDILVQRKKKALAKS